MVRVSSNSDRPVQSLIWIFGYVIVATGLACKPYPHWRLPGWQRLSAGLHLDDGHKFFEDPNGGRDYDPSVASVVLGDTVGVGYEWARGAVF